ncbi:unnamed protein product [Menidia menidia]|uniref:alanine transaminase n=1 Tax=Menidia menidia TaxID=238744 RepID=A0A8S4AD58_9TELE|nr:unnamed protein product [Menidia menidia]
MTSLRDGNPRVREIRVPTLCVSEPLTQGAQKCFKEVIDVSSGDPHRAGMKPITFIRQVLAVCLYPQLLEDETLPLDVRRRAQRLLQACDGESLGSYTASSGLPHVRQSIAEFIMKRDAGVPAYSRNIFISAGAQRALMVVVKLLSGGEGQRQTGVLTPRPCPHTLPALLREAGVAAVPYRLAGGRGWAVDVSEMQRAVRSCRGRCEPRALYISNPGNPTGHVQDRRSIQDVLEFAAAQRLVLLVDEVYQDSVHGQDREFISYKRVLFEMGSEFWQAVELVSFHSLSCATVAECGLRAGYLEAVNMDPGVMHFVDTLLCTDISTPVPGQLALDLMLDPPKPGDPSYGTHIQEILLRRNTLSHNAQRALGLLRELPGVSCQPAEGGIYLYPHLQLPAEIRERAQMLGMEADAFYRQKLLEEEGLLVGAGQQGGTGGSPHLRLCVLLPPETLEEVLSRLRSFHLRLMNADISRV